MSKKFKAVPLTLKQANEYILQFHRHHKPTRGHRFSIGAYYDNKLVGIAIVGRPVSRGCDPYNIAEVTRLATDGTYNACSFLYSRCAKAAEAMGFIKIQTYILDTEPGTSLKASGWSYEYTTKGGSWADTRSRRTDQPECPKHLYSRVFQ